MHAKKRFFSILFLLLSLLMYSQDGFIRGTVFEDKTGESLPGVNLYLEGTSYGNITDLDGKFNLSVPEGKYTLKVSMISFETLVIYDVTVKRREVTLFDNLRLKPTSIEIAEVAITATQIRNTEVALTTMKRKSANLLDGVSALTLRRTGDGNAAASMKRITGVSVSNGKYVYVRGLGDRYTKTILNGMEIPGLDPDRNTIQMDIFPTNIIDNIVVFKSFSAELPADFTGGVVNIELKEFPEEMKSSISFSTAYNPDMHFNSDYLTYSGGKTDWLGIEDGTRTIPALTNIPSRTDVINDESKLPRYTDILKSFNPNMAAYRKSNLMNVSFTFDYGDQKVKNKFSVGYNFSVSYKNETEFYKDAEYGRYGKYSDPTVYELERLSHKIGDVGINNVLWSGLAGVAIKTKNTKFKINFLHLQNGESKASILDQIREDNGTEYKAYIHNLEYQQRSLSNLILDGRTTFNESKWEVVWKISPTLSSITSPDIRTTRYTSEIDEDSYIVQGGAGDYPKRIWRNLDEYNISGVGYVTRKYKLFENNAKLKFGGSYTFKERDFVIRQFQIIPNLDQFTGDPNELLHEENLWPIEGNFSTGTFYESDFIPDNKNQFNSNVNNSAAYVSAEIKPTVLFTIIAGIRVENYIQRYTGTGQGTDGDIELNNDEVINDLDFFPNVNLIYNLSETQNLRLSYSKTIARPSFKEMSYAQIYDPLTGNEFNGALYPDIDKNSGVVYWDGNLVSTGIQNMDLRWERFFKRADMISVSAFYKTFNSPIEIYQYTIAPNSFQPRNVGDGTMLGFEFEIRHTLGIITPFLENLRFISNFTYAKSQIKMNEIEYQSRIDNVRVGETIEKYRDMAGMVPYIINGGFQYSTKTDSKYEDLELGIYYNVQGRSLQIVGVAEKPDIYSAPFHSLNFNMTKQFKKWDNLKFRISIDNILDSPYKSLYDSTNDNIYVFSEYKKGRTFIFGASYLFK